MLFCYTAVGHLPIAYNSPADNIRSQTNVRKRNLEIVSTYSKKNLFKRFLTTESVEASNEKTFCFICRIDKWAELALTSVKNVGW